MVDSAIDENSYIAGDVLRLHPHSTAWIVKDIDGPQVDVHSGNERRYLAPIDFFQQPDLRTLIEDVATIINTYKNAMARAVRGKHTFMAAVKAVADDNEVSPMASSEMLSWLGCPFHEEYGGSSWRIMEADINWLAGNASLINEAMKEV